VITKDIAGAHELLILARRGSNTQVATLYSTGGPGIAERLAASNDGRAIGSLLLLPKDRAAARAVERCANEIPGARP
jgi:hypothetical protein